MGNYSRILHHLDMKDVKKRHLKERAAKKIKEENNRKEAKAIQEIAKKYKSNWREELINEGEWQPVASGAPTNAVTQTFGYFDGGFPVPNSQTGQQVTMSLSGIGLQGTQSSTTIDLGFGETMNVDAPTFNQLAMAGYTPPLKMMRRGTPEDTNPKLDASQEFVQKIGADYMMNARVQDAEKEIKEKAKKLEELNKKISELNKLAAQQSKKISKMRDDGLKKIDAKYDERKKIRDRMVRKFEASFPSLRYTISGAMQITDKADSDRYYKTEGDFYKKVDATWNAMTKKIDAERKAFLEKMNKLYDSTVAKYNQEEFNLTQYELPTAEAEYRDALDNYSDALRGQTPEELSLQQQLSELPENIRNALLKVLNDLKSSGLQVGAAKAVFDFYMNKFVNNPSNTPQDLTRFYGKETLNKLSQFLSNNKIVNKDGSQFDIDFSELINNDISLGSSIGKLDYARGDRVTDKGSYFEISKLYDFDGLDDIAGSSNRLVGIGAAAYALLKGILPHVTRFGPNGISFEKVSPTMKLIIRVDKKTGKITTTPSKAVNKIKSMSKERAARKALSLDEPIVRSSKKSKKKRG